MKVVCMKEKTKKMPIEKGLAAKIYLLAYPKPKSGYEIAKEIYGYDHHRVRDVIKELAKEDYLIPVKEDEWRHPKWLSSVEPIIDRVKEIKQAENIELTEFDIHILRRILDSQVFREYIGNYIEKLTRNFPSKYHIDRVMISPIDFILEEVEVTFIIDRDIKAKAKLSGEKKIFEKEVRTIEEFDKMFEAYNWLKSLPYERLLEIPEEHQEYFKFLWKNLNDKENLYAFFPINFPEDTLERLKRISSFGRKFYEVKWFIDSFNANIGKERSIECKF